MYELTPYSPPHPSSSQLPVSHPTTQTKNLHNASGLLVAHEGEDVLMPHMCVSCGSTERGGTFITRQLHWSPRWTYVTLLISPFIFFLCYYAARKSLKTQYYLCPPCAARMQKVRVGAGLGWGALIAGLFLTVAAGSFEVTMIVSMIVLFAMIPLALLGRLPVRITAYQEGRFILATRAAAFAERLGYLPGASSPAPHPHPPHLTHQHASPSPTQQTPRPPTAKAPADGTDGQI